MPLSVRTFSGVEEAARALDASRSARFFGGGTLVMRWVNEGDQSFDTLIRVADPALREVRVEGDRITIGALVTMAQIVGHRDLAFLAPAARIVGGPAIRNMATVGGNLFAATPYGDLTTALLALDATVSTAGSFGGRPTPLQDFLRDRDSPARRIVTSIAIARPQDPRRFRFLKVSRVKPKGVSLLSIAAYLPQSGGRVTQARVAYGSMAPAPIRVPAVERALEGRQLDGSGIAAAVAAATDGLDPPTDALASSWYRREVAPVHLRRLLLDGGAR